jgi:hypothetical protein
MMKRDLKTSGCEEAKARHGVTVSIDGVPAKIRTKNLPNIGLDRGRYINLPGGSLRYSHM